MAMSYAYLPPGLNAIFKQTNKQIFHSWSRARFSLKSHLYRHLALYCHHVNAGAKQPIG